MSRMPSKGSPLLAKASAETSPGGGNGRSRCGYERPQQKPRRNHAGLRCTPLLPGRTMSTFVGPKGIVRDILLVAGGSEPTTTGIPTFTDLVQPTEETEGKAGGSKVKFGTRENGIKARQARTLKDAARRATAEHERTLSHLTARQRLGISIAKVSQADTDAIIANLVARAKSGEDKAIHAYARLLDQSFGRAGEEKVADDRPMVDKTFEEMTSQERSQYRAELLARIRAYNDASDPRAVVTDSNVGVPAAVPAVPPGGAITT